MHSQHRSVSEVYGVARMPLSHRESQKHCAEWSAVHRGALLFLFIKSKSTFIFVGQLLNKMLESVFFFFF